MAATRHFLRPRKLVLRTSSIAARRSRRALLLVVAACEARAPASEPAVHWTYAPPPAAFPLGEASARIGRSQAPQLAERLGIAGAPERGLRLPTPWAVPGAGPARAIVYGLDGDKPAVELIDVDAGRVLWRDPGACAGPVVGVTEHAVVCTDASGLRAIGMDGKPTWKSEQTFLAMTDDRVVAAGPGEAVILDADKGDELSRVKLPASVGIETLVASCGDAGRELFAFGADGKLARIAEGKGGPQIAWAVAVGTVAGVDACAGGSVLATTASESGTSLVALARDGGAITGRVDGVYGYWPARDGSDRIEVATLGGVRSYARDLSASTPVALPVLGELLGKRGELRLVRASKHSAAVLDRRGVRAYVPFAEMAAVLGDSHAVAASWLGSPAHTVRRFALPARYRRALRVPGRRDPVAVPAELRDLPPLAQVDESRAMIGGDARAIADVAIDGSSVYAIAVQADSAGIARADLNAKWAWLAADGCAGPQAFALAVARDVVVCAAHVKDGAVVRATGKDGAARWAWHSDEVDALAAAGDVVLGFAGDHVTVLDAGSGRVLGTLASDDGDAMRAAVIDTKDVTLVATYERGRVIARVPHARLVPAWSLAIDGVVRALAPAGAGVLVDLEDGDAFRIDGTTGEPVALPGLDLDWRGYADVVTGEAPGEPIPPAVMPIPPKVIPKPVPRYEVQEHDPPIAVPWTVPPPGPAAWQLTLYELAGGLRARNDYALAPPIKPAARGPAGSPFVALYGPGSREALVIDARRGDPVRRVQIADQGRAFSTVVDGKPVAGIVLANPLRVVLF